MVFHEMGMLKGSLLVLLGWGGCLEVVLDWWVGDVGAAGVAGVAGVVGGAGGAGGAKGTKLLNCRVFGVVLGNDTGF